MSTKYRIHGVPTILTKGAVDVLLDRCVSVRYGDGIRPMTEEEKEKIRLQNQHFSEKVFVFWPLPIRSPMKCFAPRQNVVMYSWD